MKHNATLSHGAATMFLPHKVFRLALCLILTLTSASALAFEGLGTESDPYLIKNINDWNQLGDDVNSGSKNYYGTFFRLTADITPLLSSAAWKQATAS